MIFDTTFMGLMGLNPPVATPSIITLSPHDPGDLGTSPKGWSTQVSAPTLTQVKWRVGIDGAKTINFAFGTPGQSAVPNYNHGDVINFTGYGTGFTLAKDVSGPNSFLAQGTSGSTVLVIGTETAVSDIRYTVAGSGGTGPIAYTIVNLSGGIATINATFSIAGDSLVVKNVDETTGDTSGPVLFSGSAARTISISPHDPGDLVTAPKVWNTTVNALNLTQVKWGVFDATPNLNMQWTTVNVVNGSVSIAPTFTRAGERLYVRSIDDLVEDISGYVAFSAVTKSITLNPSAPGDLGTAPKNWTTVVTATGLPQVKWAVFDANFNSSMTWQVENVVNSTVSVTCTFNQAGERLIVKSLDETVEAVSPQVSFNTVYVPPVSGGDLGIAQAWLRPLTNGVNIERQAGGERDAAYFTRLKNNGVSHVRLFIPTKASWGFADNTTIGYYLNSVAAAISVGMPVHIDAQDVVEPGDVEDGGTLGYVQRYADQIAARNFNPQYLIVGAVNEYAYMTNDYYRQYRESYHNAMRQRLPNHILVTSAADWGHPDTLMNGTMSLLSDKKVIYQWHMYPYEAHLESSMRYFGDRLQAWSNNNNVPVYCGEMGNVYTGPESATDYGIIPSIINANARGMGHQRPTHWTVTDGSFYRLNNSNNYDLRSEVAAAMKAGDAFIKQQSYYSAANSQPAAVVTAPATPAATDDLSFAKAWLAPLATGLNIEREAGAGRDAAYFTRLKNNGITHVRFFVPTKASWGFASNDTLNNYFNSVAAAVSVDMRVHIDAQDIVEPGDVENSGTIGYVQRFGDQFAARNFDPKMVILGAVQEYAYMTNAYYQPFRVNYHNALRQRLPNHIIVDNSADWGAPYTLINGSFVINSDKRKIYQWHLYPGDANQVAPMTSLGNDVRTWANNQNVAVYCGEIGMGDSSGANAQNFGLFPAVIDAAARGFGHQRPTHWTITNGSWWRFNKADSYDIKDEFIQPIKDSTAFIKSQGYYTAASTLSSPTTLAAPTPGVVAKVDLLHRGQSNAYFADMYDGPGRLKAAFESLSGISMNVISRRETTNNTLHSGTFSFFEPGNQGRWITPPSNNYASDPSTWTNNPPDWNNSPVSETIGALQNYASSDPAVPLIDLRLHWEYDMGVNNGAANAAYKDGAWEITKRLMAARPKNAGKSMHLYAYCPYQGGSWNALDVLMTAWQNDVNDASRDVLMACGNMIDAEPNTQYDSNGDYSHWGDQSAPRMYPRIAFRLAKEVYRRGWCPSSINLDDCPSMGPYISAISRAGNSLNLTITHDKGTGLSAGIDGIDWRAFTWNNTGGGADATGGAITGNNTIRVDFAAAVPNTGTEVLGYCYYPTFRRKQLIRDNWHSIRPSKYANVPYVSVVEFPLQRTLTRISF